MALLPLLINWRTENVETMYNVYLDKVRIFFWTLSPLPVLNWIYLFGKLWTNSAVTKNNSAHQLMVSIHLLKFVRLVFFLLSIRSVDCGWQTILQIGTIETISMNSIELDLILGIFPHFIFGLKFQGLFVLQHST